MTSTRSTPTDSPPAASSEPPAPGSVPGSHEARSSGVVETGIRWWLAAYRVELVLFLVTFTVLTCFSSQRFLRQSAAPHFVYQARAWLDGRLDVDPEVLPNLEDWACVRDVGGAKRRCVGQPQAGDKWYV